MEADRKATEEEATNAATVKLVGEALCLDFVNTVSSYLSDEPREHLTSYAALVAWSRHAAILDELAAQQLLAAAEQHPQETTAIWQNAIALRAALHGIFAATAQGDAAPDEDLATFNEALASAMRHTRIDQIEGTYIWTWQEDQALDRMLWPIVRSAAELLTEGDLTRVRQCSGERCGWLFVDASKNRSRRWCDMQDCGNVAKVRRFRTRQRAGHNH